MNSNQYLRPPKTPKGLIRDAKYGKYFVLLTISDASVTTQHP